MATCNQPGPPRGLPDPPYIEREPRRIAPVCAASYIYTQGTGTRSAPITNPLGTHLNIYMYKYIIHSFQLLSRFNKARAQHCFSYNSDMKDDSEWLKRNVRLPYSSSTRCAFDDDRPPVLTDDPEPSVGQPALHP